MKVLNFIKYVYHGILKYITTYVCTPKVKTKHCYLT